MARISDLCKHVNLFTVDSDCSQFSILGIGVQ